MHLFIPVNKANIKKPYTRRKKTECVNFCVSRLNNAKNKTKTFFFVGNFR